MLKKVVPFSILFLSLFCVNAQLRDNVQLAIEPGFIFLSSAENLSGFLNVEPKVKIAKNTFVGLRVNTVLNSQKISNHNPAQYQMRDKYDNGGFSFVPTLDRYFYEKRIAGKFFRPYLGLGAGVYLMTKYIDVFSYATRNEFLVEVDKQAGALFRAGLESGRLRLGLEYNLLRKAKIQLPNGQQIGTVNNSYLGLSFGFIFKHKVS